jgi:tRNA(Ile2) C34 agmatinyltransferase TiaS
MTEPVQEKFIKKVIKIIDRWSFEQCASCEDGSMISIEGMLDFKCSKCGKTMNPINYLGEIAKVVFILRDKVEKKQD